MMNYLWGGMLLIGIVYGAIVGNMQDITDAVLQSSKEAITLSISMLGIVAFWSGLMETAVDAGIMEGMMKWMRPFMRLLFPRIPQNHEALTAISTNCVANILGLGWAATPAGLQAMERLALLEEQRGNPQYIKTEDGKQERIASDEMCTFLTLNISSLQLIPVSMLAYRSQYGSVNPAAIIAPAIIATSINTVLAIVFCKVMCRKKDKDTKQLCNTSYVT